MSDLPLLVTPFVAVHRRGRHVVAHLQRPAKVLSTCHVNGGLRRDLTHLVNHQSCEPVKHQARFAFIAGLGQAAYQAHVCGELGLAAASTAVMGTAAAMQYLGIVTHAWDDLAVTAIVTAGVTGNAGSAGDAASYDEKNGAWVRTSPPAPPPPAAPIAAAAPATAAAPAAAADTGKAPGTHGGTINTLLLLSSPLSDSALARTAMTMTEAKTSALLALAVGSRSSWRLATGTGTDQFAIACPQEGATERTWTGKHTKAGELVGCAVREATLEALRWQNGLEPSYTRAVTHALGRFGLTEDLLRTTLATMLPPETYALLRDNWNPMLYEPQLAAAAFAYAAVLDRILYGTLGAAAARESLLHQAALMAAGLAAQPEHFARYRAQLLPYLPATGDHPTPATLLPEAMQLVGRAIATGWAGKWAPTA